MTGIRSIRLGASDLVIVLLAVVALAGATTLLWPRHFAAAYDRPTTPSVATSPTMLFIGDSYAANAYVAETSYACMAAAEVGWRCELAALPGTGYFSGGSANRFVANQYTDEQSTSFAERIIALHNVYRPDIVVLDGGRNDGLLAPAQLSQAMTYTIGLAQDVWPGADIAVIRPRNLRDPADDLGIDDAFFARLAADPQLHDVRILDPIRAVSGDAIPTLLADDGAHPNRDGERALATALATEFRTSKLVQLS